MNRASSITARLAAGRNGVVTTRDLQDQGLSPSEIKTALHAGNLVSLHRGVHRHAAVPVNRRAHLAAAVAGAGVEAVASHSSAAELWGLDLPRRRELEVTRPGSSRTRYPSVRIHRTNRLDDADVTEIDSIPVTATARTLLDVGSSYPYELVEHAAQAAIIDRKVSLTLLLEVLERVGGRGRRGSATMRAIVRASVPDEQLESLLEQRLLVVLGRSGLPDPVAQHELLCDDGRRVRLDFAWPGRRLAVEADGHRWHATSGQLRRDLARTRSIQSSGWRRFAYGWHDLRGDATPVVHELWRVWATTSP